MSTIAVVIACWLGINVAFVALRLYHTRSYIHAVDTSPELVEHTQLHLHLDPDAGNLQNLNELCRQCSQQIAEGGVEAPRT